MDALWTRIETGSLEPEGPLLARLIADAALSDGDRARIVARGADLVGRIRADVRPGLMEVFLAEYGLSTEEGIALMCLAEALLRVPDAETMDALIEDKIAPSDWGKHLGNSASPLVNASTWALMLTGKVLEEKEPGVVGHLRNAVRRLGEPVIRTAVSRAMKEMGKQFVLGETIAGAMDRAAGMEAQGYTYSYDMLGEAAKTAGDARRYATAYARAISAIASACRSDDIGVNPGISVKLSALHPRYEVAQEARVMAELVPVVRDLARQAAKARMGFNIDAEEADRLTLSLKVIEAVLSDPELAGWHGFGVVVQGYGRRAGHVIDWLHALAVKLDRKIMIRLVKGAYWDAEVKRAQVLGLDDFPVFTRKEATDVSYIANARKLLGMTDRIYPQFATHNAHTVAAILDMAGDKSAFEFQRLHGMGERLHDIVHRDEATRCRIYAPVGAHRDLLAYLVRRLLENGANSSFVHQIVDLEVAPETVAADPFAAVEAMLPDVANRVIRKGPALFAPERRNSEGFDLTDAPTLARIDAARDDGAATDFAGQPLIAGKVKGLTPRLVANPATGARVGRVTDAAREDVETALAAARPWGAPVAERARILNRAADLYEENFGPIFALLAREAGKTLADAVSELREAVDFLRYYAARAQSITAAPAGTFACISPWNFPLAIFTGQIAAALATGNAVLAKPAEQTPLIATLAAGLLLKAGVPAAALQLLPGDGATVGARLTSDPRVNGVCFTGSTETALIIRRAMAAHLAPGAALIAETGGLNAMIVDSTALPEQAVRDVVASSFQSAGQRCSALRCLYVQEDIAPHFTEMLFGAMEELALGDPWALSTDVGPVIDAEAEAGIRAHVETARKEGRLLRQLSTPRGGHFIAPTVIRVNGIGDLGREIFGPVLHLATYRAEDLAKIIADINATGYGLTFGLHTRIDNRVQEVCEALHVGNIYVNRNQIGAVVGSQPFGGEGLSGTGPKAGGPEYLARFTRPEPAPQAAAAKGAADPKPVQAALAKARTPAEIARIDLPGPTGESNRLTMTARAPFLCLGPGDAARAQADAIRALGGSAVPVEGTLAPQALTSLSGFAGALWWGDEDQARAYATALAARQGPILPLITAMPDLGHVVLERHVCVDTTASGGNAALLAEAGAA
ncbi:MAG TPA: bifunctional proline dehydrogenase/L-glutamate gamma-semialdehyde dehydrogenase PutA [Albidovulum sp.]|uniref:bifunctional proline dehydrogenase/L-glutamate gamma-semialdehyde dehydrogenase PutA n=1 Tax=Albidovulum sp. TaxID=1872424 RepID=UPI002BB7642D|nr:bifunctional proline dehydrogenase/L-glutamate gamma-semialdehyde dehydrogenase PutA [Defluviimonas sp.]MCP5353941.1 bifunctional proline dehydrogenase/L-glutamate gamma-semialdehyde dehydrogenase PutA [Paracoccaceae bacterium]MCP5376814.1 bifunctional proline dehydrogenase/L-glutamate gamma-semialdehyde dehydrogenase PutA [Paracoccaceae bacterium]HRV63622.1 bifunctional proline dehydrogenase/L-glutamate gamma-semialdehyde dehydrogenase PutA [Albidovulum sp.]